MGLGFVGVGLDGVGVWVLVWFGFGLGGVGWVGFRLGWGLAWGWVGLELGCGLVGLGPSSFDLSSASHFGRMLIRPRV